MVLGISYKADVKDIQLSPAEPVINMLKSLNAQVKIYDPFFKDTEVFGIKTESDLVSSIKNSDAILLLTNHKEFHDLDPIFLANNLKDTYCCRF